MVEENWYLARKLMPGMLVRCRHGVNPACDCVKLFDVDKECLLTKQQSITTAAQYEMNRMERSNEQNERKFSLLTQISQGGVNVENIYEDEYKPNYDCLMPRLTSKRNGLKIISIIALFILILLILFLMPMFNTNMCDSNEYFYTNYTLACSAVDNFCNVY